MLNLNELIKYTELSCGSSWENAEAQRKKKNMRNKRNCLFL
jgi:hypothetical protein